ncbi:alpha/beta fold hydrolase [Sphingomonas sp. FW199]|uniref:alpha/beta fold hydrolase n=1 Tax=Sphingomonas sp. FW199 TaxID=3400217 RepID=UPI003CF1EB57
MIRHLITLMLVALLSGHAMAQPATPEIRMDHISITSMGTGDPVILIPGMASPRAVWDGVAPDLAKTHRVLLVQVNGFANDDPGKNLSPGIIDGIVTDLATYAAREKLNKPAVIGHSLGGLVAMKLAADHPALPGRIMAVDTLPFFGVLFGASDAATAEGQAQRVRAAITAGAMPAASTPVTSDPGGIWSITPAGRIQVANWSRMADPRVVAQATYEDIVLDMRPRLSAITAPFTVLYATGAGPMAKTLWEREYAGSPARLVPVADSWHFIMLDQPAAFSRELQAFLTK